jgi:hypothetical protein
MAGPPNLAFVNRPPPRLRRGERGEARSQAHSAGLVTSPSPPRSRLPWRSQALGWLQRGAELGALWTTLWTPLRGNTPA